jgi:PAS domain S-box-containing protein
MENWQVQGEFKALHASAAVRAVTDSVKDYAIFLLDPQGIVVTWNVGAERLKGYTAPEIIGQSIERFYTEQDRAAGLSSALLAEAAREGRVEHEGWRVRKDGSRFWADVIINRIQGKSGELIGFTKVTRDLTDRRKTDDDLRQSEERLRRMIESVKDYAIFMLDPQGRVTSWNAGAERLKGFTAAEIVGQHFSRFYLPEDLAARKPERELEIASATGRFEEEGWRLRKDGTRFWANVVLSAVRDGEHRLLGFTKITRDMTERRQAAEKVMQRAMQQSAVSSLGLYALQTPDLDRVRDRALDVIRETLRVDDVRILSAGEPAPRAAMTAVIHAADAQGESGTLAVLSGRELNANDTAFLQAVANVVAAAFIRARAEERLRAAERQAVEERGRTLQAQQALNERDDFISVAAHELRTPLTALQLKLQGLARAGSIERKTERLGGAVRQTRRLTQLVDRLLDVSRIAQGRVEIRPETFDIAVLVRQVAEDFREPAVQARSPLQLHLAEQVHGTWDRLRIEEVLVNLLSNAVKYGAGKPIVVTLDAASDTVRLAVADQGIGIAPEDVGRIFGRFQRAAPIRNYGGMGLGLFITRHIVEAHGGTISVVSKVGEGATFVVELPSRRTVVAAEQEHLKARA